MLWTPTVVLQHTLPDRSSHFDWLLSRTPDPVRELGEDARVLVSFRLSLMPDWSRLDHPFEAVRIADHRARYLTYEGPVGGGGGGSVERVAEGLCVIEELDDDDGFGRIRVRLGGGAGRVLSAIRLQVSAADAICSEFTNCIRSDDTFIQPFGIWRLGHVSLGS